MRGLVIGLVLLLAGCTDADVEERRRRAGPDASPAALMRVADAGRGQRLFGQCAACHTIGQGAPDRAGPNLHGVMGQSIGERRPRYGYSEALQAKEGRWTVEAMSAWLHDPQRFAPGTTMRYPGIADPLDRADLIAFLRNQS